MWRREPVAGLPRRLTTARPSLAPAASSPLDFQEIPDAPLNPLYETAQSALDKSCYTTIDWKISEDSMVIDAIHRMVANDIGALAVTHKVHGDVIGVISERDYLNKVSEGRFIHER